MRRRRTEHAWTWTAGGMVVTVRDRLPMKDAVHGLLSIICDLMDGLDRSDP